MPERGEDEAGEALHKRLVQAIADPGQFTPRGDNYEEPIPSWGARAVVIALGLERVGCSTSWTSTTRLLTLLVAQRHFRFLPVVVKGRPMCDHPNREGAMVVLRTDWADKPNAWCDPCLEPLVRALIDGGVLTRASCCGHGRRPATVCLADGRVLVVASGLDEMTTLLAAYPDINEGLT